MVEALSELQLHVLNSNDSTPTFDEIRGDKRYTSHVDITVCSEDMIPLVEDWTVVEKLTSSDHNGITFSIRLHKSHGTHITRTTRLYNTKKANWVQFHEKLTQFATENHLTHEQVEHIHNTQRIETTLHTFTQAITHACTHSIPYKKHTQTLTLPWWSEELAQLKREVTTRKRRIRCAAPVRRSRVVVEYLEKKTEYELAAKNAMTQSWKDFCSRQEREGVWEGIYRVIGRTRSRDEDLPLWVEGKALDAKGSVRVLADTFYPEDLPEDDNPEHSRIRAEAERVNDGQQGGPCDPPFTLTELHDAVGSFNPKKAPGADGFTADICREAIRHDPEWFLACLNKCLEYGHFPHPWKEATVIVLRKPGKDSYTVPKSYRPIGLLPVMGKIFEKMLVNRMKFHLLPRMSTRQFGFMPQKSTEDSLYTLMRHINDKLNKKRMLTMVSLDIEGAFDSAWWPAIRVRLAEEECPINLRRLTDSYLRGRRVRVRYSGEEYAKSTQKGCVQGSVGGPFLWNLILDPLLKDLDRRGDYVQAFADDVVLVFDGETALEIEECANDALEHVRAWGVRNKLRFAPHKTMAMVITRKLKYDTPRLSMGGIDIGMSNEIKLLGLTIDDKLTFNAHVANACRKALSFYKQLSRAAKIHWGLHPEIIRTMYTAVVEPTILYAASVWAPAATKIKVQKELNSVQRGFVQKIIKGYKTVSLNSALLLAGLLPLDIRIREAALLYEVKRGYTRQVIGDREIEMPKLYETKPHPALQKQLEFTCVADGAALEQYLNEDGLNIFTDGSKIEGKVGAALSIWRGAAETSTRKLRLDERCTVFQAELLALVEATRETIKRSCTTCSIFCDSRSALEAVIDINSFHPLAATIRDNIHAIERQTKTVRLYWIKAHVGIEGNERADELAKDAALKLKTKANYDSCPVSFAKRAIRSGSLDEWNRRYQNAAQGSITRIFFPDAIKAHNIIKKLKFDNILAQLLTGHGGFSSYLHRFKCKESPSCICDPAAEETVMHVIVECPVFGKQRFEVEMELNLDINKENIVELIGNNIYRDTFIEYCRYVITKVGIRNK